jgi:hypothetical protein
MSAFSALSRAENPALRAQNMEMAMEMHKLLPN